MGVWTTIKNRIKQKENWKKVSCSVVFDQQCYWWLRCYLRNSDIYLVFPNREGGGIDNGALQSALGRYGSRPWNAEDTCSLRVDHKPKKIDQIRWLKEWFHLALRCFIILVVACLKRPDHHCRLCLFFVLFFELVWRRETVVNKTI
jgi:hypothetical protein